MSVEFVLLMAMGNNEIPRRRVVSGYYPDSTTVTGLSVILAVLAFLNSIVLSLESSRSEVT